MNKYVMILVEQYERYKAFMKSTNENDKSLQNKVKTDSREDSLLMSVKKKIDYKIGIPQEKSFKTKKKSRILPPPGLPQSKVNQKIQNDQQRGEGGRGEGSKPH